MSSKTPAKRIEVNASASAGFLHTLLLSAVVPVVSVAFFILAFVEMFIYYVVLRRHRRSPGRQLRTGLSGRQPIAVFDPDDASLNWTHLRREYVDRGIPIVFRRSGGQSISSVSPPASAIEEAFVSGCIRVVGEPWAGPLPGLDELVRKLFPISPRAYWPFWFLGQYAQGKAHIDLPLHICNCYFLRTGTKDVIIVPPEVTKTQKLCKGIDGLYIDGSESDGREYLRELPYYYQVDLPAQSVLVFNNAACIHQFRNVRDAEGNWPQALSLRVTHIAAVDARLWWHLMTDVHMAWRFTGVFLNQIFSGRPEERDAKYL